MKLKLIINISILIFLLFNSTLSLATGVWHSSTVAEIYAWSNGKFVVKFVEDSSSCTHSSNPKYYYVEVGQNGVTLEGSQKMYSALLTAASTGKLVYINFDDSTSNCYINRLNVIFQEVE